ncbi:MAG: HAL/PAL/TAL family ammonia-lyase [Myxococcota bacterium]
MSPLDGQSLSLADLVAVARGAAPPALSAEARARMARSRAWVAEVQDGDRPIYGVNTGFGSLARVRIAPEDTSRLSINLIRSHAAGVGPDAPAEVVRAMVLLRANALARGASGCRVELVDTLVAMLARGVTPVVPRQGSCGSSGDLAPLAHLGLVVFGEGGAADVDGARLSGPEAMARAGIATLVPQAKEGLAVTNGAQMTTAIAALALFDADRLLAAAEVAAAMSIEALRGVTRAFHPAVHALRPYAGAVATAARLRELLAGSTLTDSLPGKVQDAYSLRCTPVVLGACRDTLAFGRGMVEVELNSVTDNPVVLMDVEDDDHAFSAGLFHGEPVGIACDAAKIAVAEIASLSERRLFRLTTGSLSGRLPAALAGADKPGLGMLVPQTAAAALVSENKALAWPASVDSIPTCEDQEDHVAMSTTAAWRLREVVENSRRVVAIELLCAARALRFRLAEDPKTRLGAGTGPALEQVERAVEGKAVASEQIEAVAAVIAHGGLS